MKKLRDLGGAGGIWGAFILIGLVTTAFSFGGPLVRVLQARGWRSTPCTILSSGLTVGGDEDGGETATIAVEYEYFVEEQRHVSSRYNFAVMGPTGSYKAKRRVVENLPADHRSTCYVNPRNPLEAVLERGFLGEYFWGLIPLFFSALGAFGLRVRVPKRGP